ncbi:MAG: ABC transporter substrate-binding protein [Devosia sp.]
MNLFRAALLATALSLPMSSVAAFAATPADALVVAQNIDDIVALDPAQAYEFTSGEINSNVYDRLIGYEAEDTTVLAPGLATEWTADDAAKTIKFTLRDAKFASGNPVRPEDVVFSFTRVIKLNLTPAFILTQLGWTPENIADMVTVEGNTVIVKYDGDFSSAFVLNVLASRPASIVDEVLVTANAVGDDMGNAWLNTHSAGSGPFVMSDYRPAEIVRLTANENYFRGAPAMKSIIIRHVAEAATQQLLLTSGDVDIAKNLTPDQIESLSTDKIKVETYPQAAVHFLSFNQKDEDLTPPAVWEAARYLVDYDGMTQSFLKGQMETHQAFWPKGFPGSYDETPFTHDVEKAKRILADAGIKTPINVTLDVINASPFTDMAQSLQATFAEAGINFDILPGTGAQVITKYRERTHQAMLLYWGPDFMDPHSNAKAFAYNADNSDENYQATTTWRNAWAVPDAMNKEVTAALAESDQAKRNADYIEIQKQAQESSPIVIMFQAALTIAMAKNVEGYVNGATSDFVYYRLVKKD